MMRTMVLYHGGGCSDGFTSAWLFSKAFPDAEFIACNHGDPVPDVYGARVFILDFSWNSVEMVSLIERANSVVLLDHHETAAKELKGLVAWFANRSRNPEIVFDMGKSGARLAWEWLWRAGLLTKWLDREPLSLANPPWLVQYVEDRDLWRWQLIGSRAVDASIRSHPKSFEAWDALHATNDLLMLAAEGAAILRSEQQTIAAHCKNATLVVVDGHEVLAVNATTLISEIAGELARGRPFGASFFDRADGFRVWSLRSTDEGLNVADIARRFGGGGHAHAAGFNVGIAGPVAPALKLREAA